MASPLIDTHAHLDDERFAADLPAVLERATAAGVTHTFTIGVDLPTSRSAGELAARFPQLRAGVGIQPNHVAEAGAGDWGEIVELAGAAANVGGRRAAGPDPGGGPAPLPVQGE